MTVREKLIACWRKDYSNEEAAYTAGITLENLKEMLDADETLRDAEMKARSYLRCKTKDNISELIEEGNLRGTLFYAEKRMSDQYSTRQDVSVTGEVETVPVEDKEAALREEIKKILNAQ